MSKDSKARFQKGKLLTFIPTGEYYFSKGLKAYHRRDFHKAKKYLQRAMQLEPGEPMIVCQLAVVHAEIGEHPESNRLLHLILEELDQEMVECHYFLANNYAHLGFFKDAYHHAKLYMEMEEDGEFAEDTEELLELLTLETDELDEELYEQDDLINKQEQARELLESGHFPKAVELLTSVIDEYPEYWSAYNNLALAYFYLGEVEKAADILAKVFEENPGNLHALCNKLVFSYYEGDYKEVHLLRDALKKIKPMSVEHQYKLGATFALIGEYELAFGWLRKLQKQGFDGDGPFYYWLSYSAYYSGLENLARSAWKKALEMNPDKAGFEPWNEERESINGFEDHYASIQKKLDSDHMEERLFALFLTAVSSKKNDLLSSANIKKNLKFSQLEKDYLAFVQSGNHTYYTSAAHDIAGLLYKNYRPVGTVEAGLYLMWFSAFVEMVKAGQKINNPQAHAGAVSYIWHKLRNDNVSQTEIAKNYGVSTSTLRKYIQSMNDYLH
ncbi:tetratricopeptide repeat protein [Cytobacillus purgationiresistens]|uniref:Tetratricopeptide (TPR) repeat protein n=1 Tax=Cytobacillus purgationiresistens TaxID=863449 RepID=A0ABU0ACQ4_9BACI|nr:tetratricopeptide repeat protein [Cytobacillus purgationiresistens]MDQ0269035.1 tetratricopeptide (TPR) repeat protein [Cytobacillus purgationiresistens]